MVEHTQGSQPITGAASIIRSLEELGVDTVFGLPGGAILPTFDPLYGSTKLHNILVRHEQGAGHAAEGYAQATGKVGVCIVTSGPGATNLLTPILDAYLDSRPLLVITGQVGSSLIGTDAFQEADVVGATMPFAKHSFLVKEASEVPAAIAAAYHIASTGRPGPVVVDVTKNAQNDLMDFNWPPVIDLPGYKPTEKPHARQIKEAAKLLATASRPVILVGGGIVFGGATEPLRKLVELSGVPVVTTLMGLGCVPQDHPQNLGMAGMHGTVPAVAALQNADLIVGLATRFDDRVTGMLSGFAPNAQFVHADIDPAEIGKNVPVAVPIVGEIAKTIKGLIDDLTEIKEKKGLADIGPWWDLVNGWRSRYPLGYQRPSDGKLSPEYVIERLGKLTLERDPEAIFASGVGQHQMWASQFINFTHPGQWINSGGAGTMGFGVPSAMGAKVGKPDTIVWCVDGDGSFQMTNQELATCRLEGVPVKIAIINNSSLGMVRQWQTLFYGERYSATDLHTGSDESLIPDFVKMADAYGCLGLRCHTEDEVDEVIAQALAVNDRPVVIDFQVSKDAMVWPMVPSGVPNDDIQYARGLSPDFGEGNPEER